MSMRTCHRITVGDHESLIPPVFLQLYMVISSLLYYLTRLNNIHSELKFVIPQKLVQ